MHETILHSDLAAAPGRGAGLFGRRRWRLWVLVGETALLIGGFAAHLWPVLTVSEVRYQGPSLWEAEVRSLVTLPSDGNILHFRPDDAESRIESRFSDRGDAQVRIELPGRIAIRMNPFAPRLWSDGGIGIAPDGSLLADPAERPTLPRWNPGIEWEGSTPLAERARAAAATWAEFRRADSRFELITDEWTCDPTYGWMSTAVDGKTRIILGHTDIAARAQRVSRLLAQGDTLLAKPCVIDARFNDHLLLSLVPEAPPDSTTADSAMVADGDPATAPTKQIKAAPSKRQGKAKGRPEPVR